MKAVGGVEVEQPTEVLVGRQPILDRAGKTVGYELLFRPHGSEFRGGSEATSTVIANTLIEFGCEQVLGSRRGFVNFTEELLASDQAFLLPRERFVIEILETVQPTRTVLEACARLREAGYILAVDDVVNEQVARPFLPYTDYVKIDVPMVEVRDRRRLCRAFQQQGQLVLAEKIETPAEFQAALEDGCDLFQGYFFARPELLTTRNVPAAKTACLRLVKELYQRDMKFQRLEEITRQDIGLARSLLRYVNSAEMGSRWPIESIGQAFMRLGEENIRKWITIATLPSLAADRPSEVVVESLVRARFCELAAENHGGGSMTADRCFLVGLFSMLDVLVGRPLDAVLREMSLDPVVIDAILDRPGNGKTASALLKMAIALERCHFEDGERLAHELGIGVADAFVWYREATAWADLLVR